MPTTSVYIRGVSEELAARLDEFALANALNGRSAAAKFLLNRALSAEGFGAAVTPDTTEQAASR